MTIDSRCINTLFPSNPLGGKWSHDIENRKKIPKNINVPIFRNFKDTAHTKDIKKIINNVFPDNYGKT